jgi:hypothetical protein
MHGEDVYLHFVSIEFCPKICDVLVVDLPFQST